MYDPFVCGSTSNCTLIENSCLIHLIFIKIKIPENYSLRNVRKCVRSDRKILDPFLHPDSQQKLRPMGENITALTEEIKAP